MIIEKENTKLFCGASVELFHVYDRINGSLKEVGVFGLDDEDKDEMYLEYIKRREQYKGRRYLEKVINWIFDELKPKKLTVLPLSKYHKYYESLGFRIYKQYGDDIYYIKEREINNE